MLSCFAWAVPGIMATRTIEDRKVRLATILVAPLMSCSARLPIYTIFIAAFIPNEGLVGGWIGLQGLTLWYRGRPAAVGSLSYDAGSQTYTMTGDGSGIAGTADEFHYAFKQLTVTGSITVKVETLTDTGPSARAGVMIRITPDPNAARGSDRPQRPGIGRTLAGRHGQYRTDGAGESPAGRRVFTRPEDLMQVRGIGPKKVQRLRPFLRCGDGRAGP